MKLGWKEHHLHELADMRLGKMLDQRKNKGVFYPYLANVNVLWGKIEMSDLRQMRFEESEFEKYSLRTGDIVMCEGGEPGRCAIWKSQNQNMMIQKALHRIRAKNNVDSTFLYYSLYYKGKNGYFNGFFTGSAIKHLTGVNLSRVKIELPDKNSQGKIAAILSAYDDLIENNLKRIKLLKEKAQLTYEEWFVRMKFPGHETTPIDEETGLPKGWESVKLSEIGGFLNGYAFKPKDLGEDGMPVIKIKEMKGGVVSDTPRNTGNEVPQKYIVNNGDILFSWSATLEVVVWNFETGLLNQHLFKVTPNKDYGKSYVFLSTKNSLKIFDLLTTGATMKHIKRKELDFVKLNKPPKAIMDQFEEIVGRCIQNVLSLSKQNQLLKEARDILLPRLMTGMIDVDKLDLSAFEQGDAEDMLMAAEPGVEYRSAHDE